MTSFLPFIIKVVRLVPSVQLTDFTFEAARGDRLAATLRRWELGAGSWELSHALSCRRCLAARSLTVCKKSLKKIAIRLNFCGSSETIRKFQPKVCWIK